MLLSCTRQKYLKQFLFQGKKYEPVAKSQMKKMTKLWNQEVRKAAEKQKKDAEAAEATRKRAEEAKKIVIEENKSLTPAVRIRIDQGKEHREIRVKVMLLLVWVDLHHKTFKYTKFSHIIPFIVIRFYRCMDGYIVCEDKEKQ